MYKQLRDTLLLGEMRPAGTESDEVLHRHPPDHSHTQTVSPHVCVCILCIVSTRTSDLCCPHNGALSLICLLIADTFLVQCVRTSKQPFFLLTITFSASPTASITCPTAFWLFFYVKRCLYKPLLQLTFPGTHSKRYLFTWVKKEKSYTSNWFLLYFLGKVWDEGLAKS